MISCLSFVSVIPGFAAVVVVITTDNSIEHCRLIAFDEGVHILMVSSGTSAWMPYNFKVNGRHLSRCGSDCLDLVY